MSTKKQTDQSSKNTLNYDPKSKGLYDQLTQGGGSFLQGLINNPFGNASYKLGLGQSMKGAAQGGQNNINALMQNQKVSGLGGNAGAGFLQAQLGKTGRANQSMMSNANLSNVMNALQRQMTATGMGMSFNPLLTGETGKSQTTEQTSGLGTWLPQLLGGLASGAMGAMTGGASMAAGPAMGGAMNAPVSSLKQFSGFNQLPGPPPPTWGGYNPLGGG